MRAMQQEPKDKSEFMGIMEKVFGDNLTSEISSALQLGYHKCAGIDKHGFISNNAVDTLVRGARRTVRFKKRKQKPEDSITKVKPENFADMRIHTNTPSTPACSIDMPDSYAVRSAVSSSIWPAAWGLVNYEDSWNHPNHHVYHHVYQSEAMGQLQLSPF